MIQIDIKTSSSEFLHLIAEAFEMQHAQTMHLTGAVPDEYVAGLERSADKALDVAKEIRTELTRRATERATMQAYYLGRARARNSLN